MEEHPCGIRSLKEIGMTVNTPAPSTGTMDVDEFMAFMETRPKGEHWDLIEGVAVMMASASYLHQRVASNFRDLLNSAFAARGLELYAFADVAVRSPGVRNYQPEPDVVVAPAEVDAFYYSESFQLAAEVLSPSNTRLEVDLKTRLYCKTSGNLYAVVIDSTKFMVEIYAKSRKWEPVVLKRADDVIEMPEFGLRCRVVDLYVGTPAARSRRDS
jgi:Uma2 family endonuclease